MVTYVSSMIPIYIIIMTYLSLSLSLPNYHIHISLHSFLFVINHTSLYHADIPAVLSSKTLTSLPLSLSLSPSVIPP